MTEQRAIVSGGGIGGLAAAVSLARTGWHVTVLEQAAVFWEAGAGLLVTRNGWRCLERIGAADAVIADGAVVRNLGVRDLDGGWVLQFADGPDLQAIGVHRRALHSALLECAAAQERITLLPGCRVIDAAPGQDRGAQATVVWLEDGETRVGHADLLVIADGAQSALRRTVDSAPTVSSGFSSWRAVVDDAVWPEATAQTWWGPGAEFSAQAIGGGKACWQATFRHDAGRGFGDDRSAARERFRDWPETVQDLVAATADGMLVRHDLFEVRPDAQTFVTGRAVLLGDAAHAMLPTLFQGANQALEDAVVLGHCLSRGLELGRALAEYDAQRRERTQKVAHWARAVTERGAGGGGRSIVGWMQAAGVTPGRSLKRAQRIFGWEPPTG
ncbi:MULTISPECIES: FAD-dependent monooxygenase [unclassified Luteococcus]|uniref:FAD-dependent monooxygenase n=1 Tax=unclassified Luteococcus TaxID=2639923 RepID=UPI00313A84F8